MTKIVLRLAEKYNISGFRRLGCAEFDCAKHPLTSHVHKDAIELCYIVSGQQSYSVDSTVYTLRGNDIFMTYPNESHGSASCYQEKSKLYYAIIETVNNEENFLGFPNGEAASLAKALTENKNRVFKGNQEILNILKEIFRIDETDLPLNKVLIQSLCVLLLTKTLKCSEETSKGLSSDMQKGLDYIAKNIYTDLTPGKIADICFLSLPRFKQKFKAEIGISPAEYVTREKLNIAKNLLKEKKTVTEIANILNFSSPQHLSVAFKKFCGFTPSEYLSQINSNSE